MNKQPFYHETQAFTGDSQAIVKVIQALPHVIKSSVEVVGEGIDRQLLFTATDDMSREATQALRKLLGKGLKFDVTAEPGDPADLM